MLSERKTKMLLLSEKIDVCRYKSGNQAIDNTHYRMEKVTRKQKN